jgi:general bacterial porin, GBP family
MILRKSLISLAPLALCAFVSAAFADDSSVTVYGTLDTGIANVQHSLDFDPNFVTAVNPTINGGTQSATGLFNGGLSATKWGIKGQEDMGGGLKALFLLEQGFSLPSGSVSNAALSLANNGAAGPNTSVDSAISGQFFNRGAYVGVSGGYGTLTLGRQQSFFLDNVAIFDPMLGSQAFSPLGFSGSYGGGGFTDDSRTDNSLKYKLNAGDFSLGALYKLGGIAGSANAQSAYELNGVYATGPFAVQLGFEDFIDAFSLSNPGNAPTGAISAIAANTKAGMLAAKYTWNPITVRLGFEREEFNNPSNPGKAATATTGATGDLAVNSLFGQTISSVNVSKYASQKTLNVYWLGAGYDITPAFTLAAAVYHIAQNSYESGTTTLTTTASGALNYYSLVGDYHLSKRTDMYAGVMQDQASGGEH